MTESEARQKWCPFYRVSISDIHEVKFDNRDSEFDADRFSSCCIASDCMAWRWDLTAGELAAIREEFPDDPDFDDDEPSGYCGLAGIVRLDAPGKP